MAGTKKSKAEKAETDETTDAAPAVTTAAKELAKAEKDNPSATPEERAEFKVEKEKREKRKVEATEKALKDGQVAETKDGKTGVTTNKTGDVVIFNVGEYAFRPLKEIPTWYLHHLMADATDLIKWRSLTKEQQEEVSKELASRSGSESGIDQSVFPAGQGAGAVSDLETMQERRAKEASPIPVGSAAQTPTFGKADSLGHGTGTIPGPGGQPMIAGDSRKETDEAIDKAAETGGAGAGEGAGEGGVTGSETGPDGGPATDHVPGAAKKTTRHK